MKTLLTLQRANGGPTRAKIVPGNPSDVSDRVVRIKRAFGLRLTHGVQTFTGKTLI